MDTGAFSGYYVTLQCDNNTLYEGEVLEIDERRQLITLIHASQGKCNKAVPFLRCWVLL